MKACAPSTCGYRKAVVPARPKAPARLPGLTVRSIAEASRTTKGAPMNGSGSVLEDVKMKTLSVVGKDAPSGTKDVYRSVAYSVRDQLIKRFNATHAHWEARSPRIARSQRQAFLNVYVKALPVSCACSCDPELRICPCAKALLCPGTQSTGPSLARNSPSRQLAFCQGDNILDKLPYFACWSDEPRPAIQPLYLYGDLTRVSSATGSVSQAKDAKFVYYLSAEFLMGRTLTNAIYNMGLEGPYAESLRAMGVEMETVVAEERDAALGNGGLGRLAACFLDSIATLDLPGWGYGIRYKYGMFKQALDTTGKQTELPDIWLTDGNPWEVKRGDIRYEVCFGGHSEKKKDKDGKESSIWVPAEKVRMC
eukprot:284920-Chlamydomonas_euryale.AAC.5